MDRIAKYLQRLSTKDLQSVEQAILQILSDDTTNLQKKKLRGQANIFRVRVGQTRIIYYQQNDEVRILSVSKRDEKTYKDY